MNTDMITELLRHTLFVAIEISAPFLLLALIIGILVSFLQSAIHIQEMTLAFVPKMIVIGIALAILFPWILKILVKFTHDLFFFQWVKIIHDTSC